MGEPNIQIEMEQEGVGSLGISIFNLNWHSAISLIKTNLTGRKNLR